MSEARRLTPLHEVSLTVLRDNLGRILARVTQEEVRILIRKHGRTVAVLVSPRDFEDLEYYEDERLLGPIKKHYAQRAARHASAEEITSARTEEGYHGGFDD